MAQARIASRLVNCLFPTKVISADAEETRRYNSCFPRSFFTKELAGEEPPSFAAMKRLYERASDLFGFRPWQILSESELVVTRDSKSGEPWYCSVMGSMGEVYSMQAYRGEEGLRLFRSIAAEDLTDPGEVLASMHCLCVEFISRKELKRQDRELLAALGHPQGRGLASPAFRVIRPGFHPWFVNAEEARTLAECIRSVVVICAAIANQKDVNFWDRADTYPIVTRADGTEPRYNIDLIKPVLPAQPPIAPVNLPEELLHPLRGKDYAVRGAMELEYVFSGAAMGKANERAACVAIALAVDAETGIVYAPEAIDTSVPTAEALARVFLKAVLSNRAFPREVRLRSQKHAASLGPLMESFGVTLRVANRLPAAEEARAHLLGFMGGKQ